MTSARVRFLLLLCCLSGVWQRTSGQVAVPGFLLFLQDELKPSLQDPVWDTLRQALFPIFLKEVFIVPIIRVNMIFTGAAYEALVPYTDKMEGLMFGSKLRRPKAERTLANKRTAIAFATYRALTIAYGARAMPYIAPTFTALGFNPNDTSTDITTPVGLGNYVGKAVAAKYLNDGANQVGNLPNVTYNRLRYLEYGDYKPVNTAYELKDKTRWQPLRVLVDNSYIVVQEPNLLVSGLMAMESGGYPSDYKLPPPKGSYHPESEEYKKQADEIIAASAELDDKKKVEAELFDGASADGGYRFLLNKYNWTLDQRVAFQLTLLMSISDGFIATNYQKRKYDSIRPISVIRSSGLYDNIRAWGGPNQGTVTMKAEEWIQYCVRTDPSPEYPSGATTGINSYATAAARVLGTQEFGWSPTAPPGSSGVEPGTPKDTVRLHYATFKDYGKAVIRARINGGVHFREAAEAGAKLGHQVGRKVAAKLIRLFKGLEFKHTAFG